MPPLDLLRKPTMSRLAPIILRRSRRSFSTSFSSYEYPLATEAPEITKTTAQEAAARSTATPSPPRLPDDPFDDAGALSSSEIEARREWKDLRTAVRMTAITEQIPPEIPSNFPASELPPPATLLTTLDNGIRVVSQETYGQVSTIGVVSGLGSQYENDANHGVTNLLEALAFGTTKQYSGQEVTEILQDWGGTRFCNTGREQSLHCLDLLRPNVESGMALLREVMLESQFLPQEVLEAARALEYQSLDMPSELLLTEAVQAGAFGKQPLGQAHYASPEALALLSADKVHDYWQRHVVQNPYNLVFSGAGVRHERFCEYVERNFGHLKQSQEKLELVPSVYQGGESFRHHMPIDGLVRVAIALPTGGWTSDELVPACVMQTLLGGGNSFSAGGPGKGMYSRLYRMVLNRYPWAESAEAFTSFFQDTGVWGLSGSTYTHKAREMMQVLAEHVARLAIQPVTDEELSRARNMLKCNVLTQLESRLVLFEDLGRQVLTYGKREEMLRTCEKIDNVTAQDLMELAQRSLKAGTPTIAAVGEALDQVPRQDEVARWFG